MKTKTKMRIVMDGRNETGNRNGNRNESDDDVRK